MNYEIHNNNLPHLHMHLFPRRPDDAIVGRPVDLKETHHHYTDEQLSMLKAALGSTVLPGSGGLCHSGRSRSAEGDGMALSAWCDSFFRFKKLHLSHDTVDTDCVLAALVEESRQPGAEGRAVAEVLAGMAVDADVLLESMESTRPRVWPFDMGGTTPRVTARVELLHQRASLAARQPGPGRGDAAAQQAVHYLYAVLSEDTGPAAAALRLCGVDLAVARRHLSLAEPQAAHILPALWPAPLQRRRAAFEAGLVEGDPGYESLPALVLPNSTEPSADAPATGFVWTSDGQQLELWADPAGPIHLRVRADSETSIVLSAEAAELVGRMLEATWRQVSAERWEPVYEAERRRRPPRQR